MLFKAKVNAMIVNGSFRKMDKQLFVADLGENAESAQKAFDHLKEVYPEPNYNVQLLAETTIRLHLDRTEDCFAELQKHCETMSKPVRQVGGKESVNGKAD